VQKLNFFSLLCSFDGDQPVPHRTSLSRRGGAQSKHVQRLWLTLHSSSTSLPPPPHCTMQYRAAHIVEERMKQMEDAIHKRDFQLYGELTMRVLHLFFFSFFNIKTNNNFIL
jgi:hypothetical protein